jgi:hypothetical protein
VKGSDRAWLESHNRADAGESQDRRFIYRIGGVEDALVTTQNWRAARDLCRKSAEFLIKTWLLRKMQLKKGFGGAFLRFFLDASRARNTRKQKKNGFPLKRAIKKRVSGPFFYFSLFRPPRFLHSENEKKNVPAPNFEFKNQQKSN